MRYVVAALAAVALTGCGSSSSASHGAWTWILPSWRFRDYKSDHCPTDPGSSPPPSQS